ncbi:MAG: hypothetical protein AABZ60_21470, partial [Planctomycetota bacterium]
MPPILLKIHISPDSLKKGFFGGDPLTGEIHIQIQKNKIHCQKLTISFGWEIRGSGIPESDPRKQIQLLYQGDWLFGQTYSYPFTLKISPEGPFPSSGENFQLRYILTVMIQTPFSKTLTQKLLIPVLPNPQGKKIYRAGPNDLKADPLSLNLAEFSPFLIFRIILFFSLFLSLFMLPAGKIILNFV